MNHERGAAEQNHILFTGTLHFKMFLVFENLHNSVNSTALINDRLRHALNA
jgi:hypothetical protein